MKNELIYQNDNQDDNDYDPNNDSELEISPEEWHDIEDDILDIMFPDRGEDDFDEDDISHDNVFGDD
jgi:hypothetical protein